MGSNFLGLVTTVIEGSHISQKSMSALDLARLLSFLFLSECPCMIVSGVLVNVFPEERKWFYIGIEKIFRRYPVFLFFLLELLFLTIRLCFESITFDVTDLKCGLIKHKLLWDEMTFYCQKPMVNIFNTTEKDQSTDLRITFSTSLTLAKGSKN